MADASKIIGTQVQTVRLGQTISQAYNGHHSVPAKISMKAIDWETGEEILPERAFQWNPESISDDYQVSWSPKDIPGASHPLMQWNANGARIISFELKMTRDLKTPQKLQEESEDSISGGFEQSLGLQVDPTDDRNKRYNMNIPAAIAYLRSCCYPEYTKERRGANVKPPPLLLLNVPGLALSEDGSDVIYCVLTQCNINYQKAWDDGTPKVVVATVVFQQVIQTDRGIQFRGRKNFLDRINGAQGGYGNPSHDYPMLAKEKIKL